MDKNKGNDNGGKLPELGQWICQREVNQKKKSEPGVREEESPKKR